MSVARAYAKALFETAQAQKKDAPKTDVLEGELQSFASLISESRSLRVALEGPATSPKEKASLIEVLAQKAGVSRLMTQFLVLLARKQRVALLNEIRESFREVWLENQGAVLGRLVSADPIEDSEVEGYSSALGKHLGKKVAFAKEVDPNLLAGVKLIVNGVTYDGTLRSQLERLRERLVFGDGAIQ